MKGITYTVVIVVILAVLVAWIYNGLVRLRNRVDNAWAQVDVQLKRRYDLIPNLVETVKGYASHERETFEAVVEARAAAQAAGTVEEQAQAENILTGALRQLFALAEAYPELKAASNFLSLQQELSETEDKISVARQIYNDSTLTYNNAVQTVPRNLVASMFGFAAKPYFEAGDDERTVPKVGF
ncbi:MAG: LemA family protein [Acidimicrobiia bacterium]|nr:LemA family protein [Acidimicrobiia bacterium]